MKNIVNDTEIQYNPSQLYIIPESKSFQAESDEITYLLKTCAKIEWLITESTYKKLAKVSGLQEALSLLQSGYERIYVIRPTKTDPRLVYVIGPETSPSKGVELVDTDSELNTFLSEIDAISNEILPEKLFILTKDKRIAKCISKGTQLGLKKISILTELKGFSMNSLMKNFKQ